MARDFLYSWSYVRPLDDDEQRTWSPVIILLSPLRYDL